jgi:CRISPR-associated protein (TIGR02584 family)
MNHRNILLLVTGMTPQIVTETVYGLAVTSDQQASWVPDEIHVISTTSGLTQIRATLFKDQIFQKLCDDYQLPPIKFDESCLHSINTADGIALNDLKTPQDNELAANTICHYVRQYTQAEYSTELHVSIAGGRKTMGFYAGYALSLYGRPNDRMSHVLVSSDFEASREFFYPAPIQNRDFATSANKNERLDTHLAQVWLANIPFVRLRGSLPKSSLINDAAFSEVVESINLAHRPQVVLNIAKQNIGVGSLSCELPARDFAFYWWFAASQSQGIDQIIAPRKAISANATTKDDCPEMATLAADYLNYYARLKGEMGADSVQNTLKNGMERSFFDERISNIKKKFRQAFGADVTAQIEISNLKLVANRANQTKPADQIYSDTNQNKIAMGSYGLTLDVDQIMIHG